MPQTINSKQEDKKSYLRVYDLKMPLAKRVGFFGAALWLIVAVGKANKIIEAQLSEKIIATAWPYLFAAGLLELVLVFSIFLYLCHLTFSTTVIDFYNDLRKYTVALRICGIQLSKQALTVADGARVYVQKTKKFFAWHIYTIRVGQKAPLIISRLDREKCLATAKEIADYLGLEVEEV